MELPKTPKCVIFSTEWNYIDNQMAIFQIALSHLAVPEGQPEQTMCVFTSWFQNSKDQSPNSRYEPS